MLLDGLPAELRPIVQPIDDWNLCRRLGLVIAARGGGGKLLLASIDLRNDLEARPVARQLRRSLLEYAAGPGFAPAVSLSPDRVRGLMEDAPGGEAGTGAGAATARAGAEYAHTEV